jgi:hypothetical protein
MEHDPTDLLANEDPFAAAGQHGFIAKAKSAYIIVFDDESQLHRFYDAIKLLRKKYPKARTHGARVDQLIQSFLNENGNNNQ